MLRFHKQLIIWIVWWSNFVRIWAVVQKKFSRVRSMWCHSCLGHPSQPLLLEYQSLDRSTDKSRRDWLQVWMHYIIKPFTIRQGLIYRQQNGPKFLPLASFKRFISQAWQKPKVAFAWMVNVPIAGDWDRRTLTTPATFFEVVKIHFRIIQQSDAK